MLVLGTQKFNSGEGIGSENHINLALLVIGLVSAGE